MTYHRLPLEFYKCWPIPVWGGFIVTVEDDLVYWDSENGTCHKVGSEVFDSEEADGVGDHV